EQKLDALPRRHLAFLVLLLAALSSAASFGELVAFFQFFQFLFEVHGGNYKLGIRIRLEAVVALERVPGYPLARVKPCGASLRRPDEGVWAYVVSGARCRGQLLHAGAHGLVLVLLAVEVNDRGHLIATGFLRIDRWNLLLAHLDAFGSEVLEGQIDDDKLGFGLCGAPCLRAGSMNDANYESPASQVGRSKLSRDLRVAHAEELVVRVEHLVVEFGLVSKRVLHPRHDYDVFNAVTIEFGRQRRIAGIQGVLRTKLLLEKCVIHGVRTLGI